MGLPIGVPKIIVTPIASGHRRFGPLVGTQGRDGRALGRRYPRPQSDQHGDLRQRRRRPRRHGCSTDIRLTIAGRQPPRRDHDARQHHEGRDGDPRRAGDARTTKRDLPLQRRRRAGDGRAGGSRACSPASIDFTTDELADELVGGFHDAGRRAAAAASAELGLPQVVVPGCIDFSVHGPPEAVPRAAAGAAGLHAQSGVHAGAHAAPDEMAAARRRIFAERLNDADRPGRGDGPDQRPVDSQRAGRRRSGIPTPTPAFLTALRQAPAPDIPLSTRIHVTSTRPSSRWRSPIALSRCSPRKDNRP